MDRDEMLRALAALDREAVGALYRLKRGTMRPLDHQDAAMPRQAFGIEDEPS
jgi:hypothetical protein